MKPKTLVKKLGGINSTAEKLCYTPRTIRNWLAMGKIPHPAMKLIRALGYA